MKRKNRKKESYEARIKRLEMSDAVQTRIVPDKKKYTRKKKHKGKV